MEEDDIHEEENFRASIAAFAEKRAKTEEKYTERFLYWNYMKNTWPSIEGRMVASLVALEKKVKKMHQEVQSAMQLYTVKLDDCYRIITNSTVNVKMPELSSDEDEIEDLDPSPELVVEEAMKLLEDSDSDLMGLDLEEEARQASAPENVASMEEGSTAPESMEEGLVSAPEKVVSMEEEASASENVVSTEEIPETPVTVSE